MLSFTKIIVCFSGTTGAFKGVMLSHTNIISNVLQLMQGWADYWEPKPRSISFLVRPGSAQTACEGLS